MKTFLASTILLMVLASMSIASTPTPMNYQGLLSDNLGNPVDDGSYTVKFTVYDAPVGGAVLWTETQPITTTDGLFAVLLGSTTAIADSIFSETVRYLGIQIQLDPEMTPREELVSVPYAFHVATVDSASGGTITSKLSVGPDHTNTGLNAFVAGESNTVTGERSTVGGGFGNSATNKSATVGGGNGNSATNEYSTVAGGRSNASSSAGSAVLGGEGNSASGVFSTVGAGEANIAQGFKSTVAGGGQNTAGGDSSTVSGGRSNTALGISSTISGGGSNLAGGVASTVGGGSTNYALGTGATIAGGIADSAVGTYSVISGGTSNYAGGIQTVIGGGRSNALRGDAEYSTISGGRGNLVDDEDYATIGGGRSNLARGQNATVGGGQANSATRYSSTVPGGLSNSADGEFSFAAGRFAKANHKGAVVWGGGDEADTNFVSTADYQFLIRAGGGVAINTNDPAGSALKVVGDICYTGSIAACSDERYKTSVSPLSNSLAKVLQMRGVNYRWKQSEFPDQNFDNKPHLGFMAQEVESCFPELVVTNSNAYKPVDHGRLTPILVEAIKEQQNTIVRLSAEVAKVEGVQEELARIKLRLDQFMKINDTNNQKSSEKRGFVGLPSHNQ